MTDPLTIDSVETDILVLGAGGAGLCAALHAADRSSSLAIGVAVKGLLGRAGCTRMVQGGYNAVLTPPDSIDAHFLDTTKLDIEAAFFAAVRLIDAAIGRAAHS